MTDKKQQMLKSRLEGLGRDAGRVFSILANSGDFPPRDGAEFIAEALNHGFMETANCRLDDLFLSAGDAVMIVKAKAPDATGQPEYGALFKPSLSDPAVFNSSLSIVVQAIYMNLVNNSQAHADYMKNSGHSEFDGSSLHRKCYAKSLVEAMMESAAKDFKALTDLDIAAETPIPGVDSDGTREYIPEGAGPAVQ